MQHERLAALAIEAVDDLRIARGAERGDHERLRFAAREQSRAVGARQNTDFDGDRADRLRVAAVDARLAVEDALADDVAFELEDQALDLVRSPPGGLAACERGDRLCLDFRDA